MIAALAVTAGSPSRAVFARNVWRLRVAQGMTQCEFALKVGYSSASRISDIEGDRNPPNLNTVDQFAKALGVTAAQLLTWSGQ